MTRSSCSYHEHMMPLIEVYPCMPTR